MHYPEIWINFTYEMQMYCNVSLNKKLMKALKKFVLFTVTVCLLVACSKSDDFRGFEPQGHKYGHDNEFHHISGLDQERYVTIKSMDLKVHYRIVGKGPVDMVFIPGWTNPLTVYKYQFDYFRDKARCIYIDLPGHGLSDAPEGIEYTMGLMADAIYEVVKKEGVKKFIGVGFSWGHIPLTQFEIKHPGMITQLILLDNGVNTWPPMTEEIRKATYEAMLAMTPDVKITQLNGLIPPMTAPEDLKEWGKYFLAFPNWLLANMNYNYLAEEVCQPYPWSVPILAICRVVAPGSPKEAKFKLYFPGCDIRVIGGDQHCIQWAYNVTVNQMIDDFMIDRPGRRY
jgi:pimeloyl-ACP methyl ester carboxylesterase